MVSEAGQLLPGSPVYTNMPSPVIITFCYIIIFTPACAPYLYQPTKTPLYQLYGRPVVCGSI